MDSLYTTVYIGNILTIESAVLAGPITFTNTVTVTGTLVIV